MSNPHLVFFFLCRQLLIYRYSPNLWKLNLYHYTFTKVSTLVTVFTNWNKSEENVHFYKTQQKEQSAFVSQQAVTEVASMQVAPSSAFPGNYLSTELPGFWTVLVNICAYLTFPMTVTKMCPKERASLLFYTTWLRKKDTPFSNRWGNL